MSQTLFQTLAKRNIIDSPTAYDAIEHMDTFQAIELLGACFDSIGSIDDDFKATAFTFAPVSSISGGLHPCNSGQCRLEAAYSLSLFGALYADRLILPNYFDYFHHLIKNAQYPFSNESQEKQFKYNLFNDIAVCFSYKPLIDAGLAIFNHTTPALCGSCYKKRVSKSKQFEKNIVKTLATITPKLRKNIKFVLVDKDYIAVEDTENYVGGELGWGLRKDHLKYMTKHAKQIPHNLTYNEIKRLGLFDEIIDETIDDLLEHNFYMGKSQVTYLTDRQLDIEIIETANPATASLRQGTDSLYHNLPFLEDVLIEDLIALRNVENDKFQVYRDTITEVVNNPEEAKELVTKKLNPILHKIDSIISDNKRHYRARVNKTLIQRGALVATGFVSSNLLNLPADALNTIATVGGAYSGIEVTKDFNTSNEIPVDARNNNYYYLWKVRRLSHSR